MVVNIRGLTIELNFQWLNLINRRRLTTVVVDAMVKPGISLPPMVPPRKLAVHLADKMLKEARIAAALPLKG